MLAVVYAPIRVAGTRNVWIIVLCLACQGAWKGVSVCLSVCFVSEWNKCMNQWMNEKDDSFHTAQFPVWLIGAYCLMWLWGRHLHVTFAKTPRSIQTVCKPPYIDTTKVYCCDACDCKRFSHVAVALCRLNGNLVTHVCHLKPENKPLLSRDAWRGCGCWSRVWFNARTFCIQYSVNEYRRPWFYGGSSHRYSAISLCWEVVNLCHLPAHNARRSAVSGSYWHRPSGS